MPEKERNISLFQGSSYLPIHLQVLADETRKIFVRKLCSRFLNLAVMTSFNVIFTLIEPLL